MVALYRSLIRLLAQFGHWLDEHADQIIFILGHRVTRGLTAWLVVGLTVWVVMDQAWGAFDNGNYEDGQRVDGNYGHSTIDFGGQWMMGAMLRDGHGPELYHRAIQREVLRDAYPREREDPAAPRSDADKLMSYFMGTDSPQAAEVIGSFLVPIGGGASPLDVSVLATVANEGWTASRLDTATKPRIGGPLYPPINALVYYPLATMPPHTSYRVAQCLNVFWALVAAIGVRYMTRGQVWVSMAMFIIMLYPGFKGSIHLGQNAALTLAILVWGWALLVRGHPIAGGLVWGFLAFKPVWGIAFFLVPFVTFRWRTCAAMATMGILLALVTLPFVGYRPWLDWLAVGGDATELYKVDYNWVHLSRDLLGIPRRYMLDFTLPSARRDTVAATVAGWALFIGCLMFTLAMPLWRRREARALTGTAAGFLLLGAWLTCFHFMYYDVLLTALGLFVLLAEPRRFLEPVLFTVARFGDEPPQSDFTRYYGPWPVNQEPPLVPLLQPGFRQVWVLSRFVPQALLALIAIEHFFPHIGLVGTLSWRWGDFPLKTTTIFQGEDQPVVVYQRMAELASMKVTTSLYDAGQPWDTYCIIALWLWCGFLWIRAALVTAPPVERKKLDADVVLVEPAS